VCARARACVCARRACACEQSCTVIGGHGEKNSTSVKTFTYFADCPYDFTYVIPPALPFRCRAFCGADSRRLLMLIHSRPAKSQDFLRSGVVSRGRRWRKHGCMHAHRPCEPCLHHQQICVAHTRRGCGLVAHMSGEAEGEMRLRDPCYRFFDVLLMNKCLSVNNCSPFSSRSRCATAL